MDDSILKIVLMHLMALGAFRPVLRLNHDADALVLMHLMALGAFRHDTQYRTVARVVGLNAPYGARCFPTRTYLTNKVKNQAMS